MVKIGATRINTSSSSRTSKGKESTQQSSGSAPPSRIIGEGEMAELIRGFDWGKTLLGPEETWPDILITTVNLLLASRHPMFLWWGPGLIQFYNDGYRPCIRADKHPSAVGQRGIECWPEIWPIIGPQIEAVMNQGVSTWNTNQLVPINRNGSLEEVYWTYSYSPVRDKDGTVHGTLVVCSETTEQVLSERRLRTLLAITGDSAAKDQLRESRELLPFAETLVKKLDEIPIDIPFAALHLLTQGDFLHAGSTASTGALSHPEHWPLATVVDAGTPMLIDDLNQRFGDISCPPWPEPVTRAYLLPLQVSGSPIRAVLVFGISPRLPFDKNYETFFHLIGARITGLLQSEIHQEELAEAAKRFSRLAEANPFGMVIGNLRGELEYANPAFLNTLGYSSAELSSGMVRWDDLTPPEFSDADAHALRQLLATGQCEVYEKAYIAKDGREIPILLGASIIESSTREPKIAAFVTDLSPLKLAQEELRKANDALEKKVTQRTAALESEILDRRRAEISLRELTGRLLLAQDEERRFMARELHDHAGQTLVALGMNLSALQAAAKAQSSGIVSLAAQTQQLSDDLSKEIRTLSYLLHPPLLDETGLASALRWYVEGFSERSKIQVEIDLPANLHRLPRELELVIFRVVQESLTNIHRHSGSSSARIHLSRSESAVEFEVSDRGKGMKPERLLEMTAARVGVGVRGMEERIRQFHGTLRIDSNGEGTKVAVTIPLTSSAAS
jgi:PAS domain S-box-containing protein